MSTDLSERADARTATDLAVLSVPLDGRVLLIGDDGSAAVALVARGCVVTEPADVADVDPDARFDAAVLLGVLERAEHPAEVLHRAAACLAPEGRIVASVRNATHGALRLDLLRGRLPDLPPRYDRSGFDRLFRECGLAVVERLGVRREVDTTGFAPEVVATVEADPDAAVHELLVVAQHPSAATSTAAPRSVAEALQDDLDRAEKAVADRDVRIAEVEMSLAAARAEVDASGARIRELEEALAARAAEVDAQSRQLAAAVMDLELKDGFTLEMRAQLTASEEEAERLRQGLAATQARLAQAEAGLSALQVARADELNRVLAEAAQVRGRLESELAAIKARAGYRLIEQVNGALGRLGPVAKATRWIARQAARVS